MQNIEIGDEGALAASALLLPLVGYMISDVQIFNPTVIVISNSFFCW